MKMIRLNSLYIWEIKKYNYILKSLIPLKREDKAKTQIYLKIRTQKAEMTKAINSSSVAAQTQSISIILNKKIEKKSK